jgi:hypothetical protein
LSEGRQGGGGSHEVLEAPLESPHSRVEEEVHTVHRAEKVRRPHFTSIGLEHAARENSVISKSNFSRMLYEMIGTKKTLLGSWPQNRGEMCYTHHPLDTRKAVARQILISH